MEKASTMRIVVDRSSEIEALQGDVKTANDMITLKEMENEDLKAKLQLIAEKEFHAKRQALEKSGVDTSAIDETSDHERQVEILKQLDLEKDLKKLSTAPQGGETTTFYQNEHEPSKTDKVVSEAVREALMTQGYPIEDIEFSNLDDMKKTLRKVALDSGNPQQKKAISALNELTHRATHHSFEYEYEGRITELGKSEKARRKGEWKEVRKGESEK
jgi:FtsZ-binding cell division protein ZapB